MATIPANAHRVLNNEREVRFSAAIKQGFALVSRKITGKQEDQ
jgi:hypothetical protein